jgi:hypothetical protein
MKVFQLAIHPRHQHLDQHYLYRQRHHQQQQGKSLLRQMSQMSSQKQQGQQHRSWRVLTSAMP